MIPARWTLTDRPDPASTSSLASELRIPEALAALLVQRGYGEPSSAKAFLRPELERLSDPLEWADMRVALATLGAAVRGGKPILIHGDYDVDGQCGAALLTRVLRAAGANVHAFVPHRLRERTQGMVRVERDGDLGLEVAAAHGVDPGLELHERTAEVGLLGPDVTSLVHSTRSVSPEPSGMDSTSWIA